MRRLAFFLAVALALTGCTAMPAPVMQRPEESTLKAFEPALTAANNRFGFLLYRELLKGGENILISPVSVALALSMAYNGTDGETMKAMAEVLQVPAMELEQLNKSNLALLYFLRTADSKVKLDIANSVWMRKGFPFDQDFVSRVQKHYLASARELDFDDPKAADTINKWVKDSTRGLIPKIIEGSINPLTIMYLINAVYFQGEWTRKFEKGQTRDGDFYGADGTVQVPMMYQAGRFDYYRGQGFQALRLPYGQEKRMAMYVFLPDAGVGLDAFQQSLTADSWEKWLPAFAEAEGTISLPRFTLEYEESLVKALRLLGMERAFDPGRADFSRMVPRDVRDDVHISDVKHKSFIRVDESGTEAAAVTSVTVGVTSMPMYDFQMDVNRPFFYAIHDAETGSILFMGSVSSLK
jgi:serine protease inhibitor